MLEIFNECKKNKLNCIFADQPTAYKNSVSLKLKNRFWMTPPYQKYTLTLENLEKVSTLYNDWLKVNVSKNNLNFCLLSEYLEPNTDNFYDDAHFAENGSKKVAKKLKRNFISSDRSSSESNSSSSGAALSSSSEHSSGSSGTSSSSSSGSSSDSSDSSDSEMSANESSESEEREN